jgi:hypothetical protein
MMHTTDRRGEHGRDAAQRRLDNPFRELDVEAQA